MTSLAGYAGTLDRAACEAAAAPQMTHGNAAPALAHAHHILHLLLERRLARRGRRVGIKIRLTSRARMLHVRGGEGTWGRLSDALALEEGLALLRGRFANPPRIRAEVAFVMKAPLAGRAIAVRARAAVTPVTVRFKGHTKE